MTRGACLENHALLLAQKGTITDGEEAIDLGQTPGDILFLSAADTASVARPRRPPGRACAFASLMTLKHPMSVDTYVERTARHAKLIIVRPLGGASYFQYVLEALHAAAVTPPVRDRGPAGRRQARSGARTVFHRRRRRPQPLWAYFTEGGADNMARLLDYAEALLDGAEKPAPAAPLMKAGIWWPGAGSSALRSGRRLVSRRRMPPLPVGHLPHRGEINAPPQRFKAIWYDRR